MLNTIIPPIPAADPKAPALILIGDGFTEEREVVFEATAQKIIATFQSQSWLREPRLQFLSALEHSNDTTLLLASGDPPVDSPYKARYEGRQIKIDDAKARSDVAAWLERRGYVCDKYAIGVIVDNPNRGGRAYTSVFTCHDGFNCEHVAIHEWGHAAIGLGDEYSSGKGTFNPDWNEPNYPNISKDRASAKFPGGEAYFEGGFGYEKGIWRYEQNCYMRTDGVPFCAVCEAQINQYLAVDHGNVEPPATEPPPEPEQPEATGKFYVQLPGAQSSESFHNSDYGALSAIDLINSYRLRSPISG